MNKNKHLISDKLYKLLLTCRSENIGFIRYEIKKCRKELQALKPRPNMIKPEEIKIVKISMNNFLKMLLEESKNVDKNTNKKTVPL